MSVSKRLTWNEHGDPTLTVTVVGSHDVFRFADHLTRWEAEEWLSILNEVLAEQDTEWHG